MTPHTSHRPCRGPFDVLCRLVCLLALLWGQGLGQVPSPSVQPPPFRTWLWTRQEDRPTPELTAIWRDWGITGIQCSPGDDPASGHGLELYLDQVVEKDLLSLTADELAAAHPHRRTRRPTCLNEAKVMDAALSDLTNKLRPFRNRPPNFICLRDEPSYTRLLSPADWCSSPSCLDRFSAWLTERWGADGIDAAWGYEGEDIDLLAASSTESARRRFFHATHDVRALVAWNDARLFADQTFTRTLTALAQHTRKQLPSIPVGFLGMEMPSAFGGYDWEVLLSELDIVEAYDYGAVRELIGSLARPGQRILQTLVDDQKPPEAAIQKLYSGFLRGDSDVVVFSSKEACDPEDPSKPSAWMQSLSPHLKKLTSADVQAFRRAATPQPKVAILYSMADCRLHWMTSTVQDGRTWVRRTTSHQTKHGLQSRTREAWTALLHDLQVPFRFVTHAQVENGVLEREDFKALILARCAVLGPSVISSIHSFVNKGNLLIADSQPGFYAETLAMREYPALDRLMGVAHKDRSHNFVGDGMRAGAQLAELPYPLAESTLTATTGRAQLTVGNAAVLIERNEPDAHTLYLNLAVHPYLQDRLSHGNRAAWLRTHLLRRLTHSGCVPVIRFQPDLKHAPWPVRVITRRADDGTLWVALFLNLATGSEDVPWSQVLTSPEVKGEILLPQAMGGRELLSGRSIEPASKLQVALTPDRPLLLRLTPR